MNVPRAAGPNDAPELARLSGVLGYPADPHEMKTRLAHVLSEPDQHVAVIESRGGRLAGWVHVQRLVSLEGGERAELMGLVVDSEERRSGVGRALVAAAEEWARTQGVQKITVRSNLARADSHPFYEALAYRLTKSQHVYVKKLNHDAERTK